MSLKTAVGTTPVLVLFGSQNSPQTLVNTGTYTVYISDDSSVTAGVDMALGVGSSMVVEPGAVLYAVCAANENTTLTTLTDYSQRFAYGQYTGAPLDFKTFGGSGTLSGVLPWDNTLATQYKGISIGLYGNNSSLAAGVWTITFWEYDIPSVYGGQGYGRRQEVQIPIRNTIGVSSPSSFAGAIFPVYGLGGEYEVTPPAGTAANDWGVSVYGLPQAPSQATPWGLVDNSFDATYTWSRRGNLWRTDGVTVGAGVSVDLNLPPVAGPVRLYGTYTQTGAGASSATVRMNTPTASSPYDTALISASAAGTYSGWATYAVWPTTSNFVRLTTAAGVTLASGVFVLVCGSL